MQCFSGSKETIAKINQVPYQIIEYDDKGMFQVKLMDNAHIQIFIDNGATPSILPLSIYNKYPILQKYPKTEGHTPIHTGGGMIECHFWIEIPLKLDNQVIQIKTLVCDSECPDDIVLGCTSLAQLSAWQDYASRQLHMQQISIPLVAKNNVRILPGQTGIVSLVLKPSKTSFVPCHTITGKGITYVRPLNLTLPLRPVEIEFENNRCCLEVCNTSDSTIEFQYGHEVAYFDARSKGLVQINNSKHFPIHQYLHDRVTPKINQVPYQIIEYDDKGMFQVKLMDNAHIQIFIDNGATPSILPLSIYNKYPILQKYPKTEGHTPIHTGGGMIECHFWIEIPLKLDNQVIQIKTLVCDSECPDDIVLGCTSLAQLSAWQDYASRQLHMQQISIPLVAKNNVRILPGQTGIVSLVLKPSKTSFVPCHTITGKGITYVRPLNLTLPLRPVEIEFENNRCCLEVCNTSDSTIEFQYGHEVAYFDARSKGLVQINNSKHFPIHQYLHDRVTPVTLSPKPIAFDKPIDPAEMPHI